VKTPLLISVLLIPCLLVPGVSRAAWPTDGLAICTASGTQDRPRLLRDGGGGAFISWFDSRNGTHDIYIQRVDATGAILWPTDGVVLCTASGNQDDQVIVSDGAGGAIVAWADARNTDIDVYVQRIDASGSVLWTADGVPIETKTADQYNPEMIADGSGGAIIAYEDQSSGTSDIDVQRIDASGAIQWTAGGVPLCAATNNQFAPMITSDGSGGAIVTWYDLRSGTYHIYARRIDSSGAAQWTTNGVALCTAANGQYAPVIVTDGSGGAIVSWYDNRNSNYDVYAQRIDGSGAVQWTADGVALSTAANSQWLEAITSDGAGGAIVTWEDARVSSTNPDVYAQRVSAAGAVLWTADGAALSNESHAQRFPVIDTDGSGGAIVAWQDNRNGSTNIDIYAQRVNAAGAVQWTGNGVSLEAAAKSQISPSILSDGAGGAFAGYDSFTGTEYDIYAQKVGPGGLIPTGVRDTPAASAVLLSPNYPNPFTSGTAVELTLHREEPVSVEVFDAAGRRVRDIEMGTVEAGETRLAFDGRDDHARALPSGVYFYRVHAGNETVTRKMVIAR
jgi:FlgD Ig-like domain